VLQQEEFRREQEPVEQEQQLRQLRQLQRKGQERELLLLLQRELDQVLEQEQMDKKKFKKWCISILKKCGKMKK